MKNEKNFKGFTVFLLTCLVALLMATIMASLNSKADMVEDYDSQIEDLNSKIAYKDRDSEKVAKKLKAYVESIQTDCNIKGIVKSVEREYIESRGGIGEEPYITMEILLSNGNVVNDRYRTDVPVVNVGDVFEYNPCFKTLEGKGYYIDF